jgi:hypothetical protein
MPQSILVDVGINFRMRGGGGRAEHGRDQKKWLEDHEIAAFFEEGKAIAKALKGMGPASRNAVPCNAPRVTVPPHARDFIYYFCAGE